MPCDSPCLIASHLPIPASSACRPESCTGNISCLCEYRTCMVAAVLPGLVASPALPPPRPRLANPSAPRRPASIRHLKSMLWGGSRDARRDLQIERNTDLIWHTASELVWSALPPIVLTSGPTWGPISRSNLPPAFQVASLGSLSTSQQASLPP